MRGTCGCKRYHKKIQTLARRYPRYIRWSDEDKCYIGSLPDLDGDCTHGDTQGKRI